MPRLVPVLVAVLLLATGTQARAEAWPAKPVRIVVPFAPGGTADTLGRIFADPLSRTFHQQFFIDNRGGAGGLIGAAAVAHADPDGYTLLVSGIASNVIAPSINANAGFDPIKDFTQVAYFGGPPVVFVVHPSLGVKTFAELVAVARASKAPLEYVSPGPGTLGNLVAEFWARKEGFRLEHIPYKGAALAVTDLVAGNVKFGSMTWTTALPQIEAKAILPLAVSSSRRLPAFPDIPTLAELGYRDLVAVTWFSLSGPPGLPDAIVDPLNAEVRKDMDLPSVREHLAVEAIQSEKMTPAEFAAFMQAEYRKWGPLARQVIPSGAR